jgi:hypothetical protein
MTTTKANRSTSKTKANRRITKASTSNTSATKRATPASAGNGLLVLGFDEQQKPCGARFVDAKAGPGCQGRPAHGPQGVQDDLARCR